MPHHGVVNPHKPEKVRVVFNPSAPFKGTSLNDQLYKGPIDLLTSLIGVLLRFRQFPFPISGDIEKMYHQVLVPHQQQSLFRFLWNDSPSPAEPKEYLIVVHVFGAVSSPSSCIYALKKTAEDFGNRFPTIAAWTTLLLLTTFTWTTTLTPLKQKSKPLRKSKKYQPF